MEKVDLGDLVELKSGNYLILSMATYDGILYVFTNKMEPNEVIGKEYYIFKVNEDNNFILVKDEELKNILTSIFEEKLNKMLKEEGE